MYEQIKSNRRASWVLMVAIVLLLSVLGFFVGGAYTGSANGGIGFLGIFGIAAIAWSLIGYYSGDKMALTMSGARRVDHASAPQLFNVVEEMTIAGGLPQPPAIYIIESDALNAFATGRDPLHASVAVTRGLLAKLDREQLQGVIAHEMSHVRNYDIRFATLVGILVGMIALIADFFLRFTFWGGGRRRGSSEGGGQIQVIMMIVAIVLAILAPIAAYAVQFAISRRREYLADASAVELTRNPLGLARALNAISVDPIELKSTSRATAHMYVANPLKKKKNKAAAGMMDTHPPIQERIAILLKMAHVGPEVLTAAALPGTATAATDATPTTATSSAPPPAAPPPPPPRLV